MNRGQVGLLLEFDRGGHGKWKWSCHIKNGDYVPRHTGEGSMGNMANMKAK